MGTVVVRLSEGSGHHAVEYGEVIGPVTSDEAAQIFDRHGAYAVSMEVVPFREWKRQRDEWDEEDRDECR